MEHTIKAHLSITLEKSLKFTGVWLDDRLPFFTSNTFEVSTRPHLFSCIFAMFDCSIFPYFFNAKSVAYSSIPENKKEINIFSILTVFSKVFNFGSIVAHHTSIFKFIVWCIKNRNYLWVGHFMTLLGHFFANYCIIFYKIELPTIILNA